MRRKWDWDDTYHFQPSNEILQNPYIGFTSFNHFRGEPLFSDCETTDGWKKESYPLSGYLEENGEMQGWHPDTEVAYIRITWRNFEPKKGEYNYPLIDEIFEKAVAKNQSVMLRLMPHTTRGEEDVPDWLKKEIDCPERPSDKRVKESPTDRLFFEYFAKAVRALKQYDNHPAFYAMDISLYGAWGEGHKYKTVPKEYIKIILDAYTGTFKNVFLLGQICAPELVEYCRNSAKVGWRADGFGNGYHMLDFFPSAIHPIMTNYWKTAPVSFEAFWYMSEWKRQGWDIDELCEQALKWHVSTFNNKSSTIPFEWKDAVQKLLLKMGYRFALRTFKCPKKANAGDVLETYFWLENRGCAPIYKNLPVYIRLKNERYEYVFSPNIDIRKWLPDDNVEYFDIPLPTDIPKGHYEIAIKIGDGTVEKPHIHLAMQAKKTEDFYQLAQIEIE
ncbi:MAG: DUF4832 domain-containing protein [Clostridia bacterium]|nr:DUF4832 domain-containing protein [Clostridia bacterium]